MATLNISLPDNLRAYIDEQVASGRYQSASEFVRHLVRMKLEGQKDLAKGKPCENPEKQRGR